ncbi:unnamed protein product [Toxocara canis]|uniref:Serine/threonine-protein phosphatase PGAM5, mitochondrial n=1 Tax=Toxocara canis TaxID=6265 RepID=A0A183UTZ1_TOXCA|nr:unnamed protein product [Toxocara canis]
MAILSRLVVYGIPVTAALVTAGALMQDRLWPPFTARAALAATSSDAIFSSSFSSATQLFPRSKWDSNWDNRDPLSLVDEVKYDAADTATRKDMLQKAKATATRNIFLIRHAQYLIDNEQKNLTPLGHEQAVLLGKRLAQEGLKFDVLIMSSMQRASETAGLILSQMAPLATKVDSILEEGAPYPPEPPVPQWRPKQKVRI